MTIGVPQSVQMITGGFVFSVDAVLQEGHRFPSRITRFPVESGGMNSDYIINDPIDITMTGMVTNHPLVPLKSFSPGAAAADNPYKQSSQNAYNALTALRGLRQTVTLVTTLAVYENMGLANLDIPRDAKTGQVLKFTAQFQQLTIEASQTQPMPNARAGKIADQASGLNNGKQVTTTPANPPAWPDSYLYQGIYGGTPSAPTAPGP